MLRTNRQISATKNIISLSEIQSATGQSVTYGCSADMLILIVGGLKLQLACLCDLPRKVHVKC